MTNFIEIFKETANSKSLTAANMISRCVYKTLSAKSENKIELLKFFLKKAFSPARVCSHRPYPYHAITSNLWYFNRDLKAGKSWGANGWYDTEGRVLGVEINKIFTDEEAASFRSIAALITPDFVRNL